MNAFEYGFFDELEKLAGPREWFGKIRDRFSSKKSLPPGTISREEIPRLQRLEEKRKILEQRRAALIASDPAKHGTSLRPPPETISRDEIARLQRLEDKRRILDQRRDALIASDPAKHGTSISGPRPVMPPPPAPPAAPAAPARAPAPAAAPMPTTMSTVGPTAPPFAPSPSAAPAAPSPQPGSGGWSPGAKALGIGALGLTGAYALHRMNQARARKNRDEEQQG